jgi:hypothetical protein
MPNRPRCNTSARTCRRLFRILPHICSLLLESVGLRCWEPHCIPDSRNWLGLYFHHRQIAASCPLSWNTTGHCCSPAPHSEDVTHHCCFPPPRIVLERHCPLPLLSSWNTTCCHHSPPPCTILECDTLLPFPLSLTLSWDLTLCCHPPSSLHRLGMQHIVAVPLPLTLIWDMTSCCIHLRFIVRCDVMLCPFMLSPQQGFVHT